MPKPESPNPNQKIETQSGSQPTSLPDVVPLANAAMAFRIVSNRPDARSSGWRPSHPLKRGQ